MNLNVGAIMTYLLPRTKILAPYKITADIIKTSELKLLYIKTSAPLELSVFKVCKKQIKKPVAQNLIILDISFLLIRFLEKPEKILLI